MNEANRKRIVAMLHHAAERLERDGQEAERRAGEWTADGISRPTGDGGGAGKGTVSDPTASMAMRGLARDLRDELGKAEHAAFRAASHLVDQLAELMAVAKPDVVVHGDCANRMCSAKAAKAGRCMTCYAYRRRTGTDRVIGESGRAIYTEREAA